MKKKNRIIVAAMASCIALSATFTGCSLVSANNEADMAQVVATVDISKSEKFGESGLSAYSGAVSSTSIIKRDLVSYFLNVGYSYIQNGSSYEDTFNMLMDALVNNAVLTQYSTMALLKDKAKDESDALNTYLGKATEVEKYEYLLGGKDSEQVMLARYNLYSSLNSAIDNFEKSIIEEDDKYEGTETRSTPANLETEQENYYPKKEDGSLNYNVYTGYTGYLLSDSGAYSEDAIEGTTRATRIKAYNTFINNLRLNNLIEEDEKENLSDILSLNYIQNEYVSQLEARLINLYYDVYEEQQAEILVSDDYGYIQNVYTELLNGQADSYKTASAFETAMGSMSDTSFLLYSPDTSDSDLFDGENYGKFGFVYNILLPFNAKQSAELSALKSIMEADDNENDFYYQRNKLLKQITTVDQRVAWFNGATDYSFKASETSIGSEYYNGGNANREYLFFEGNLTESEEGGRYKKLRAYDGRYSYNGSVYQNADESYTLIGNELTIDSMLGEFSSYINYVLGGDFVRFDNGYEPAASNEDYYNIDNFKDDEDEIDYSNFVYASGKVDFGAFNKSDLMNAETLQYKAMSAVNELQFAYTTDVSVLSQYIGYSVSAYDTSYIKEFEYAAKKAISEGEGAFTVCAGDYGWHIIYVTYAFDKENTYTPDWKNNIEAEGTFENLFFEWIKSVDLSDISTTRRTKIISDFNKDSTVTKYQKRYQDLLDLESK